jgi:hypothetical protein
MNAMNIPELKGTLNQEVSQFDAVMFKMHPTIGETQSSQIS